MRIAMVTTNFLPNIGGVAQHIVEISGALRARGQEVEVITVDLGSDWGRFWKKPWVEKIQGVDVWRIPFVLDRRVRFFSGQITSRLSERRFVEQLMERLQATKPDVVHWHALESRLNPMARWTSSPRVWTNHTSMFLDRFGVARHRSKLLAEAAQADEVIAPSEELRDLTVRLGLDGDRVHFIPNGVDMRRFHPNAATFSWQSRLGLEAGERLILCPRRLEKKNGVSFFVKAAIRLIRQGTRDVKFVIAGDFQGNAVHCETSEVRRLIDEAGLTRQILLLGRVENSDLPGLYTLSAGVVIPSLQEATSLSAMEAMSSGKPVVASRVGGLPFLVHDKENGFLVPPQDEAALAEAMGRLLKDPALAQKLGAVGRARVERELDWSHVATHTEKIYERAMQRFRGMSCPSASLGTIPPQAELKEKA